MGVTEQFSDDRQAEPRSGSETRVSMAQIVESDATQAGVFSNHPLGAVEIRIV